jgi:hypothetical protein
VAQSAEGRLAETGMRAKGECLPASVGPLDFPVYGSNDRIDIRIRRFTCLPTRVCFRFLVMVFHLRLAI